MIAHITGTVSDTFEKGVVIDTGSIGYAIYTTTPFTVGDNISLHTHLVIRDDAQELYGFQTRDEKALFTTLIGVSGVGPKTALQMLTLYPLSHLVYAIRSGDAKTIALVPGIGKKTAEKVIIDLKDKLVGFAMSDTPRNTDLVEALLSLGYKDHQIRPVVSEISADIPIERQIAQALQLLQK